MIWKLHNVYRSAANDREWPVSAGLKQVLNYISEDIKERTWILEAEYLE